MSTCEDKKELIRKTVSEINDKLKLLGELGEDLYLKNKFTAATCPLGGSYHYECSKLVFSDGRNNWTCMFCGKNERDKNEINLQK